MISEVLAISNESKDQATGVGESVCTSFSSSRALASVNDDKAEAFSLYH